MPEEDALKKIKQALEKLSKMHVLVGIPSESSHRTNVATVSPQTISNATLGYIHEFGSPAQKIPARPFLLPGVKDSRSQWEPYMQQAAKAAFIGDDGLMKRALEAAGQTAVSAVKNKIIDKIPPPIKVATVAGRRRNRRGGTAADQRVAAYQRFTHAYAAGQASMTDSTETPLVDSAQMLNSITFVVKDK